MVIQTVFSSMQGDRCVKLGEMVVGELFRSIRLERIVEYKSCCARQKTAQGERGKLFEAKIY